jgi:hypothetical protein
VGRGAELEILVWSMFFFLAGSRGKSFFFYLFFCVDIFYLTP